MKIPAPRIQCAEQFGEVDDPASLEVDDFALAADLAVDAGQAGADDFAALAFQELGADDDVGEAGFVFEGDEHRAFGGAGALAAGDDAYAVTDTDPDMDVRPQGCVTAPYRRRRPADTLLYRVVQNHLETFLSRGRDEWWETQVLPHAERELRRFLGVWHPGSWLCPRPL